ncbi:MAG: aminotransferase class V-fold PLP-dependent enzyme [Bryobacteraceae bacterium]|nr:aminotransferase class V-fold PLP-dependent enzyme [Bryobacteraceae bacterium]
MQSRRTFFEMVSTLPLVGGLFASTGASRDFLKELGVKRIINGMGVYTMATGSLMWPETVEAMRSLSKTFVRLDDLHDAVGKRIAELLHCEAAMVPSGAAAGLTVGTAACITGTDAAKILRIPDTAGMKNEAIVQKSHRFPYDHMVRNCGVRLVEVETRAELESAINARTAMLLFLNKANPQGQVKAEEFVAIGKARGIPTMNDAAADVPPVENLFKYTKMGFDLVAFSGGKGIRGPQSAGLLLGRADLIRAARLNTAPHSDTIGRSCKVNKEELVGMMVAVEMYLKHDHEADWREWERRIKVMADAVAGLPGVRTERFVPEIANQVPHLRIHLDAAWAGITRPEVLQTLRSEEPEIEVVPGSYVPDTIEIASWMLQPGEAEIVGRRLRKALRG